MNDKKCRQNTKGYQGVNGGHVLSIKPCLHLYYVKTAVYQMLNISAIPLMRIVKESDSICGIYYHKRNETGRVEFGFE